MHSFVVSYLSDLKPRRQRLSFQCLEIFYGDVSSVEIPIRSNRQSMCDGRFFSVNIRFHIERGKKTFLPVWQVIAVERASEADVSEWRRKLSLDMIEADVAPIQLR